MLVQQMVRYLHQLKELRVMLKLDIALAFDSVSWALFEVLHHVGFGPWFQEWMVILLSSSNNRMIRPPRCCSRL